MKTTILIALSLFAACLLSVPGTLAGTKGYADSRYNYDIYQGVLGARLLPGSTYPNGIAVYGGAVSGTGYSYGGYFENDNTSGVGLRGSSFGTSGETVGGLFSAHSPAGMAVQAHSYASTGNAYGGHFTSDSETGTAVYGVATANSNKVSYGGNFNSLSTKGVGVQGMAFSNTGSTYGGYFWSNSENGTAVYGETESISGKTYGGRFIIKSKIGNAVAGEARMDKDGFSGRGGLFKSFGSGGTGVEGRATGERGYAGGHFGADGETSFGVVGVGYSRTGTNIGVYGSTRSPQGYGVYSEGNVKVVGSLNCTGNQIVGKNLLVKGDQTVTGTKSAVVKLKNGEGVSLYAVEASENWFEDFGSAKLTDGAAVVAIESVYVETVNTEIDYHVFLTPRGECKGLYVTNQKGSSFEVRELNGGKSDIPFSYRIVAKRKGYEDVRLAKVKEDMLTAMITAEEDVKKDEAISGRRKVK